MRPFIDVTRDVVKVKRTGTESPVPFADRSTVLPEVYLSPETVSFNQMKANVFSFFIAYVRSAAIRAIVPPML